MAAERRRSVDKCLTGSGSNRRGFLFLQYLHDLLEGNHVDGIVVGWASELPLLWRGWIPERDTQTATNTEIRTDSTDHSAVAIRFLDNTSGNGTRRLAD